MTSVIPSPGTTPTAAAAERDLAATGLVLGFAGAMWLAWAMEHPPAAWDVPLTVGGFLGVLVAAIAAVMTWRRRHGDSAMADPDLRRRYTGVVTVEVVAIGLGSMALGMLGHPSYIAAWILFVVGAHFVPLGLLFRTRDLEVVGVLLVPVAAAAGVTGLSGGALPSAVAGGVGGGLMVAFGAVSLWRCRQESSRERTG